MKKYIIIPILFLLGALSIKGIFFFRETTIEETITYQKEYEITLRQDLFSLMMAYPEYIIDIEVEEDHQVYLVLKSGNRILYDDKKEKTPLEKIANPDLQDMMEQQYLLGPIDELMPEDYNPGRIRVYPLLKEVYGGNPREIEGNLIGIQIHAGYHRFNSNNAAATFLKKAFTELNYQSKNNPEIWSYLHPIGGTYNYRYIARTNRLSSHSFGISIDLAIHPADYWQWATKTQAEKRLENYPQIIVDIMESNYFIWGGKWGQFDIMHYEYRPELIKKAKYFSEKHKDLWYENLPVEDSFVSEVVCLIEERL
ncbi:D-alanyl-D-alanine carboxypeptidase [Natronincola peptidivorans]|uniref:D-alanyl-D-alanine carboxypeptidase n=1 Tax=Natronincola peptidivorans TaxID=426128 RepID=A0A1I0DN83_9FIRM|nr:M15 family metallopeptidase [Natronincola peptidivorans]SET33985.1 D-alanyl-D-alanine carboxypeptidase [Natronincola peptidivorans]